MKLVVIILSEEYRLQSLLQGFSKYGIKGATILNSKGMLRALEDLDENSFLGSIKAFLDPEQTGKTVLTVIKDDQVELVSKIVKIAVGDLTQPDTGIMFTIPLDYVEGIKSD